MIGYDTHGPQCPTEGENEKRCPVCGSDEVEEVDFTIYKTTTCLNCGHSEASDD